MINHEASRWRTITKLSFLSRDLNHQPVSLPHLQVLQCSPVVLQLTLLILDLCLPLPLLLRHDEKQLKLLACGVLITHLNWHFNCIKVKFIVNIIAIYFSCFNFLTFNWHFNCFQLFNHFQHLHTTSTDIYPSTEGSSTFSSYTYINSHTQFSALFNYFQCLHRNWQPTRLKHDTKI